MNKMERKTLYNFNSVQLTFNQCVFNRIQYRTEHNLYSTRLDKVDRMKSSTRSVQLNTAWKMETQHRLYNMKIYSLTLYTFTLSPRFTLLLHSPLYTFRGMKRVETIRAFEYSCCRPSVWSVGRFRPLKLTVQDSNTAVLPNNTKTELDACLISHL